jgi:putative sugar O-methyltransferase
MLGQLVLPSQTAFASDRDMFLAAWVKQRATAAVEGRKPYIVANGVAPEFGYPDANWSIGDANNPLTRRFTRVARCDRETIARLRALSWFNGWRLYQACLGQGLDLVEDLAPFTDDVVAANLEARGDEDVRHWQALTIGVPVDCLFRFPARFGEIGQLMSGVIVNGDAVRHQERVTLLFDAGIIARLDVIVAERGELRVLEIGAGHGAMAWWFKQRFPACSYTIVDLPEVLLFSGLYLSLGRPDLRTGWGLRPVPFGCRFVSNYMAEALREEFDLVINTLSMSEMTERQVNRYAELIAGTWIAKGGSFFEQNHDNRSAGFIWAEQHLAPVIPHRRQLTHRPGSPQYGGKPSLWNVTPEV